MKGVEQTFCVLYICPGAEWVAGPPWGRAPLAAPGSKFCALLQRTPWSLPCPSRASQPMEWPSWS